LNRSIFAAALLGGLSLAALATPAAAETLRYALVSASLLTPWAIFHYWRAGVLLKRMKVG